MKLLKIIFCSLLFACGGIISGQTQTPVTLEYVTELFNTQVARFPQEKIYVHTDKQYYMSGETIWFRAHIAEARLHLPASASRYVYVEFINPLDSVVDRIKIRPEDNVHQGHISLPDDLPEGNYFIRAYTHFMRNAGPEYFASKNIYVGNPQAANLQIDAAFTYLSDKKAEAKISFINVSKQSPQIPDKITYRIDEQKEIVLKQPASDIQFQFNLPSKPSKHVMLLEVVNENYLYRKYVTIPAPEGAVDVSFYPEGGDLLENVACKVAFKALKPDGKTAAVNGKIVDQSGTEITTFNTVHAGMGSFMLTPEKGKTYYAVCNDDDKKELKFRLPAVKPQGYSLKTRWSKNQLFVGVARTEGMESAPLYIIGHVRGHVQFAGIWDFSEDFIKFPQENLYPGVMHISLLNSALQTVSERLVFIHNDDVIRSQVDYSTEQPEYYRRQLIRNKVVLTDLQGQPLSGNFSVAVTDNRFIKVDSCESIYTDLLLTSDLRGYIENPAYYFQQNRNADIALDLLMMTQGWRRYDVSKLMKNDFSKPAWMLEIGPEISGKVGEALLLGKAKPMIGTEVTAVGMNVQYTELTLTDSLGRFYFHNCELPDSAKLMVMASPKKGLKRTELTLNDDGYPGIGHDLVSSFEPSPALLADYIRQADEKYISENGMRMIYLDEVEIRAQRKPKMTSHYYTHSDFSITSEDIAKFGSMSIRNLLLTFPGIRIEGNNISLIGASGPPALMVNNRITELDELDAIDPVSIEQIDFLKNGANTIMFGPRGMNGVIVIYYKVGQFGKGLPPSNIQMMAPLGYQPAVEFYAPKYDTPETRNNPDPDLRSTIHWQPQVKTDENGVGNFEFYSADNETNYDVVIQGLAADGKIINQQGKIVVKSK